MRYFIYFSLLLLLASCGKNAKNLALAQGQPGDIYVIMDSTQRKGVIGHILDSLLQEEMPGLPREESIFRVHWVDARKLNYILKERRNLVYVLSLDQQSQGSSIIRKLFTPESISQIQNNDDQFMSTVSNVAARGQEVVFLFSRSEAVLAAHLRKEGARLVNHFNRTERERLTLSLFKAGQMKGITDMLIKDFSCSLKVPFGYKLADRSKDFLWIRQMNPKDDKDIFVSRKAYTSQEDFRREKLIAYRDEVCRKYLFADPDDTESYVMTETTVPFIPVTADTVNFNGHFAIQLRGLFRSHTPGIGGPFLGFALVDEATQQFYYIEGFTISPGREQREIMRELETILYTFQTSKNLPVSSPATQ